MTSFLATTPDSNELLIAGKQELVQLFSLLRATPAFRHTTFVFNPAIARGLDYYTGTVYETTIDGLEQYGSICSGGRYADLAGRFTSQQLPGVGLSIGLTRLLSIITERELVPVTKKSKSDIGICVVSAEQINPAISGASSLRAHGLNVEIDYRADAGLGKQLTLLERKGLLWALICESDGMFTVCNLRTHAKEKVTTLEDVITHIKPR